METNKSNNYFLIIIFLVLALGAGIYYINNQKIVNKPAQNNNQTESSDLVSNEMNVDENNQTVNLSVEGGSFYFKPNQIKVKLGQTVKIEFINTGGGIHDFVLDEFNVKSKSIGSNKTDTVEFIADKLGEFEFYCSIGNHRQMGMVGKLIVEE